MYSQLNEQEHDLMLLHEITDHSTDGNALTKDDGYHTASNGHRIPRKITKGGKVRGFPLRI